MSARYRRAGQPRRPALFYGFLVSFRYSGRNDGFLRFDSALDDGLADNTLAILE